MVKTIRFIALFLLPLCLFGCGIWGHNGADSPPNLPTEARVPNCALKIRVADVSNDTRLVYDVDAIGLLWNGVEESLKEKGMLWTPNSQCEPYVMECHIVDFKEPSLGMRLVPHEGNTVVKVRVEITRGGQHVAAFESNYTLGYGKGMWTFHASKKVFAKVSEDIVKQAADKL